MKTDPQQSQPADSKQEGAPRLSNEERAAAYLESQGFTGSKFRLCWNLKEHQVIVTGKYARFYTPGLNGEEGVRQNIRIEDLETIKAVVAMLKEDL